jgi:hypothetical protein
MCQNKGDLQPVFWRHLCAVFVRAGWCCLLSYIAGKELNEHQ